MANLFSSVLLTVNFVFQASLFEERDVGVLLSLVTLLLGIVARSYVGFEALVPRVVTLLGRLMKKDVTPDYHYYGIPSPWLQVQPCNHKHPENYENPF